jgi:hypothetical protein
MRKSRCWLLIGLVMLLTAGLLGGAAMAQGKVRVRDLTQEYKYKPVTLKIAISGTSSVRLTKLREWNSWGRKVTKSKGWMHYNTCRPTCAAGNEARKRARVQLRGIHRCNGRRVYKSIRIAHRNWPPLQAGINCKGYFRL